MSKPLRELLKHCLSERAQGGAVVGPVAVRHGADLYASVRDHCRIVMVQVDGTETWESKEGPALFEKYLDLAQGATVHGSVARGRLMDWASAEGAEPVARPDCVSCDNTGWLECIHCDGNGLCVCECSHEHPCGQCRGAGKNPCYCGRESMNGPTYPGIRPGKLGKLQAVYDRTLFLDPLMLAPEGPIVVASTPDRNYSDLLILSAPGWYFFVMPLDYGRPWDETHGVKHLEIA